MTINEISDPQSIYATQARSYPIAAVDIGTNSIRMSLVDLNLMPSPPVLNPDDPNDSDTPDENNAPIGSWTVITQHKETVRLGQGEFGQGQMDESAIVRGVQVLQKFAQLARSRGATEIVAIATAALREASNRDEFIERARERADVEVQVVSGVEEARLIYLGVVSGWDLNGQRGLFIDIGGGSTELIVGNQEEHLLLESTKMGAIRVANQFLSGTTAIGNGMTPIGNGIVSTRGATVPDEVREAIRLHVLSTATPVLRKISTLGFEMAIASSGTAMNLANVATAAGLPDCTPTYLPVAALAEVTNRLCAMTVDERRKVAGLNPERADIIPAGAIILLTLAQELDINGLHISDRSLREGVLVDSLLRRGASVVRLRPFEAGVRRRAVDTLAHKTNADTTHTAHIRHLTLRLFEETKRLGLHNEGDEERELLEYAALLHDCGMFVAHTGHHRHSYYLIRHSPLPGFTDSEIEVIANIAYFHRKSPPKKRHAHFQLLPPETQRTVRTLAVLLRLAEGLDRSHLQLVREISLERSHDPERLLLTLHAVGDPHLEVWYTEGDKGVWEATWGLPLELATEIATQG